MIKVVEALLNLAISLAMLSCASLVWLRLIWMNSMVSMVLVMEGGYVARTGMSHLFSVCCLGFWFSGVNCLLSEERLREFLYKCSEVHFHLWESA